jgi:hypothetical protein
MPIKGADDRIVGVLQAINKNDGVFGNADKEVMSLMALQVK